jgi:hypothetical protein
MLGMRSTASGAHGRTDSDFARRKTVRKGTIEEFKSVMKAVLSGQRYWISCSVSVLCPSWFSHCLSLSLISFELGSNLQQIEEFAFYSSGLQTIVIPSSVTHLCKSCFSSCSSLSSISFESGSNLQQIEESAFYSAGLTTIVIPSSVTNLCKSCFSSCC